VPVCSTCRRPAIFTVEQNGRSRRLLCDRCAQSTLAGFDPVAARFFENWLPTRLAVDTTLDALPAETACPRCGTTYAEFERVGLAGCAGCYVAFEPAILPALRRLHGAAAPHAD
jgi:protein arginine kinase activator